MARSTKRKLNRKPVTKSNKTNIKKKFINKNLRKTKSPTKLNKNFHKNKKTILNAISKSNVIVNKNFHKNKQKTNSKSKNLHKTKPETISKALSNVIINNNNIEEIISQHPGLEKYWQKRHQYFSRYDEGIQMDVESLYSVTPELIAEHQAKRMACDIIVDGFCGAGGNAIQFAKTCKTVIAIDIDPKKIEMARNNAKIYGVADKIKFYEADFLEFCEGEFLQADVVFLSPPWGGLDYWKFQYDIETALQPLAASKLMKLTRKVSNNIAFFLPRNSKPWQLEKLAENGEEYEVESNYGDNGKIKCLTVYYGEYFKKENEQIT